MTKNMQNKTELLSPAGSMAALQQAINNGADAVYLGGQSFGARAFADNFSYEDIKACADYAHLYGKKVYVTANTLIFDTKVDAFLAYIGALNDISVDAVILQDLGMAKVIKTMYPDLPLHASTQMHNFSQLSLKFLKQMGFNRAVLARECDLNEIKKPVDIEKEVFVHGALCISYSGQCLFSAMTKNRSGNQGACAQSCRMRYALLKKEDDMFKPVATEGEFLLSPKDLGLFGDIKHLLDMNITSLKIEGRMKSPEYVGYVTAVYRRLIDDYDKGKSLEVLKEEEDNLALLFNRGYTKGYIGDVFGKALMSTKRPNHKGVVIGKTTSIKKDKIVIALSGDLNQHDGIKFEKSDKGFICERIYKNGLLCSHASKGDVISLENKIELLSQDTLLKTKDTMLIKRLAKISVPKIDVDINIEANIGAPLKATFSAGKKRATIKGDIVSEAIKAPVSSEQIKAQMTKLGGSPFVCKHIEVISAGSVFVAKSALNKLRRDACEQLEKKLKSTKKRRKNLLEMVDFAYNLPSDDVIGYTVLLRNEAQLNATKGYAFKRIYTDSRDMYESNKAKNANLYYKTPRVSTNFEPMHDEKLLISDTAGLFAYGEKNDVICDDTLNAVNTYTLGTLFENGASCVTVSPEMTDDDIKLMIKKYNARFEKKPNLALLLYGRQKLMTVKNCIIESSMDAQKSCQQCKENDYALKDISGAVYPIKTDENCINEIYSNRDINRIRQIDAYTKMGITSFRLSLLDESYETCIKLFDQIF
jgi:U32 family peptidase